MSHKAAGERTAGAELDTVIREMEDYGAGLPTSAAARVWDWSVRLRAALRSQPEGKEPSEAESHCENCGAPGVELQELMCRSCWEQEPEGPRFHWRDGMYFQRVDQGAVLMTWPESWKVIPVNEWVSIVTHVSRTSNPEGKEQTDVE